jgi:hypothetical protein
MERATERQRDSNKKIPGETDRQADRESLVGRGRHRGEI